MKIWIGAAVAAGLFALTACGDRTPAENAAENVEEAAENRADLYEDQADNATNEVVEDRLEEKAEDVRDAGENKADAIEDSGQANTVGM